MAIERVNIDGVKIFPFTSREELLDYAEAHPGIMVSVNAEIVLKSTPKTRAIINSNIGYCDGAGPLMALRSMGYDGAVKIAGCEFWHYIVEQNHQVKTFYLIGSTQQVIETTVSRLRAEFPDICILGYRNGYLQTDEERQTVIDDVAAKHPDVVFVAMGVPKQELLMEAMLHRHRAIYLGLGGSFDVYTGKVRRAPKWWIDHNMEWLYRLIHQPQRLVRQAILVKFAWWILIGRFKKKMSNKVK